jgi:hypothetical protein
MNFSFKLPFFSFEGTGIFGIFGFILFIVIVIGWIMNLENVYTYCPHISFTTQFSDFDYKFGVSLLGVFLWPIGVFTGWMW